MVTMAWESNPYFSFIAFSSILPVGIFLLIIAGIMALKKVVSQKQKKKELSQAAEDRMREENLNHVILTRHAEGQKWKEA